MPFIKQAFRPQVETRNTIIGRASEQYFFTEHVLRPVEPLYNLISVWGEAGVGKSTLLTRFRDIARSIEFKDVCLTALVDERLLTPARLMECVAAQLRGAGAPLVAFEQALARYKEATQRRQEEREVARVAFLRQLPSLLGDGVRVKPVIGSFYAAVAEEASAAFWRERDALRPARTTAHPSDALAALTQAFVEDLNWLTATQIFYPSYHTSQGLRVILFFDEMEPSATELVNWLHNYLLSAPLSQNVVLVVAGRDSLAQALPQQQAIYALPLVPFTEDETRLYLAVRGILEAERCNAIWQLSGGLPLSLSLLALDPEAVIDPQEDTSANVLRWLARQGPREQQLVLHAALFSTPFLEDDLAVFRFLPESEQERIRLYRWLIGLPFVQYRSLDGRHRYHDLVQQQVKYRLSQLSAQEYQASRRALASYYRRELERIRRDAGQQIYASTEWLELALALVSQLFSLPDEASHTSAIEQVLEIAHMAKDEENIVHLLRVHSSSNLVNAGARTLAGQLLDYLEADLTSQEFFAASQTLIERVSRAYPYSATLLARIYGKRGMAYVFRDELQPAIADFDSALALDPAYAGALLLRGIAWSALGEDQRAIADFDHALSLDGSNTLAYVHRGIAYRKLKAYERAIEDFDRVLGLDPHLDEVSLLRSLTYEQFNKRVRGLGSFDHALELNPNDAHAYVLRGMAYCVLGVYEQAIKALDRAIELNPNHAQVIAGRGHVYLEMGDIGRARDDFLRSRELDPDDTDTGLLLEWAALCQDGPQPETPARLEAIAAGNPHQYAAYVCRGVALLLYERFEEALAELEQAFLLDATQGYACFWKALACAILGRDEEAAAALAQAKTAELPLPEVFFAPLRWLEQKQSDFYQKHVVLS